MDVNEIEVFVKIQKKIEVFVKIQKKNWGGGGRWRGRGRVGGSEWM